jgi:hypothetical protein
MNGTERRAASGENLQSTLAPSLSTRFQTGNWSTEAFCCFSELFPLVCLYALEFHTAGLGTVLFASTIKVECTFRHMSDLFIAAPPPIHNEPYSSLSTAAANSMAVEPTVHCLSSKAPSHIRSLPINARVQIRCASALELCRAFENRLLPHGFLPVHDNSRARIGHSVRRSLQSIGRASNPSPRFRNDMTASCSCMIPPLPSSTSQIAAAAHASCLCIIGRLFRAGELLFVVVISCCPLSITKGGHLRYGDRRSHIIGREIIDPAIASAECLRVFVCMRTRRHHRRVYMARGVPRHLRFVCYINTRLEYWATPSASRHGRQHNNMPPPFCRNISG